MSIHIGGVLGKTIQSTSESKKSDKSSRTKGGQAATDVEATDRLNLTNEATKLQTISNHLSTLPMVDAERVSNVQLALATGKFHIEPIETADHIIEQEKELASLETDKSQ